MARIAFCQDVMMEYLGYMTMSAVLKAAGHTVEVFIQKGTDEGRFIGELQSFRPDIVGFAVFAPGRDWTLRIGAGVKREIGALTIYGNVDAMLRPELIDEPGVDVVCLWEGESIMVELATCVDEGRSFTHIKGLWVKADGTVIRNEMPDSLVDLDTLPFHDRALYDKYAFFRSSKYLRVLNGRGCPNRCTFCFNHLMREHFGGARYVRKRSPEMAIREVEYQVAQRKNVKHIYFVDEVFWVTNTWMRDFLHLYKERVHIPFMANFRFGPIEEEDIKLLKDAGARWMIVAAETGDENQRCELFEKTVEDSHIVQIAEWLHKYDLDFGCSCFFGIPGETVDEHVRRLEFYRKVNPKYLWTTFFEPYPGLTLTARPEVQALLPASGEFPPLSHHNMYLDLPDKERLMRLKKVYHLCFRWPSVSRLLVSLTRYRIPLLFDLLFLLPYSWQMLMIHHYTFAQFAEHVRVFIVRPLQERLKRSHGPAGAGAHARERA